ncbi:Zn(II)2Cys6 transcription factor [Aspergillus ambiguus]|uniref:Zn(II)2Cys6 transcription factor n=1 Tax=Aspergillus ambiguus TaxID=176160 RepID=UPI003CCCED1B
MSNGAEYRKLPRLPACQSCYTKKTKCDNARPICTPCMNNGHVCLTVSLDGSEPVPREYIYELEKKVQRLQEAVIHAEPSGEAPNHCLSPGVPSYPSLASQDSSNTATQNRNSLRHDSGLSSNFADGAGISFMSLLFTDPRWRGQHHKLLQNLSRRASVLEIGVEPNALPSAREALALFNSYLNGSHVQNPFLLRRDVQGLYTSLFSEGQQSMNGCPVENRISNQALFRAFMIIAIGSVPLYRTGKHHFHPYGYYLTAMRYLEADFLSKGLDSIQDLLLVSRFGIYYHIGTSIWELIQLCTRMCIEQDLHRPGISARSRGITLLNEQQRRRVFWQCYMMDRYTSVMLDRPPAISDKDILVGFPVDADDEDLELAAESGRVVNLDEFYRVGASQTKEITEMSVFFLCLRLRQITSKIHNSFRQKTSGPRNRAMSQLELATASGAIYADLDALLVELEHWRHSAPVFQNPRCLYERQEWYDLLLMRERLLLIRKAIDLVPKFNNIPPRDLLFLCLQYAVGTITTFCWLFKQKLVTYTRSYFQTLFTAGLSVIFCVSVVKDIDLQTTMTATQAVEDGEETLKEMVHELPDAVNYVAVHEALRVDIMSKLRNFDGHDGESGHTHGIQSVISDTANQLNDGTRQSHEPCPTDQQHIDGIEHQGTPLNILWPTFTLGRTENELLPTEGHDARIENSLSSWNIFGQNLFWNMEAGMLGEYVYGDLGAAPFLDEGL